MPVAMLINLTCASGIGACEAVSVTVPERAPLETCAFRLTHKILENANRPTTRRIIELRYSDREKPIPGQEITFPREQFAFPREQFAFPREQFTFPREEMFIPD